MEKTELSSVTTAQACEFFVKKYHELGNPIWAWHAIEIWASSQLSGPSETIPIPDDLVAFLARMSRNLVLLAEGYPPTEDHDGERDKKPRNKLPRRRAINPDLAPLLKGAIDPVMEAGDAAEATELLPEALFLRGDGWNAFREWQKVQDGLELTMSLDAEAARTGDRRKAEDKLIKERKLNDRRTMQRVMEGGRGKKSPYPVVRAMRASGRAPEAEK